MVLWKHFLGLKWWSFFWGWGVGFISYSKGLLWCFRGMYYEMLLHDVKTSNMTIIWITVAVKIKEVTWASNMSIKIDYKCSYKLYMQGSVSQHEKLCDWKFVAISERNYYCYTVLIVCWRSKQFDCRIYLVTNT